MGLSEFSCVRRCSESLSVPPIADKLPSWIAESEPAPSGALRRAYIEASAGAVEGGLALGGLRFLDALTASRIAERWRIVQDPQPLTRLGTECVARARRLAPNGGGDGASALVNGF